MKILRYPVDGAVLTGREAIYQALFDIVSAAPGLITSSRRFKPWSDVSAAEQPALFQVQRKEEQMNSGIGMPYKWVLSVDEVVYVNAGEESDVIPSSTLNPIIDYMESVMPGIGPVTQTLNGMVAEARIAGEIYIEEGVMGAQAYMVVPIRIVAS